MKRRVIAVLGGDIRMNFAARKLVELGHDVREWGRNRDDDAIVFSKQANEWFSDVDVLMFPLPTSFDGTHIWTPLHESGDDLRMETFFRSAANKLWLVGRLNESLSLRIKQEGIDCIDYFESEILQLKNALPTAQGAIEIAMRELSIVLDGAKVAVIGYGRIGEVLSHKLKVLGANVTVYARRQESCIRAEIFGCNSKQIIQPSRGDDIFDFDTNTRVIFNTVPSRLFTRSVLQSLPRECLIIDLASAPGGIEINAANELGIRFIWATALPGKCAPESAGIFLGETAHSILLDV